ncbi:MAG: GTPase ObgE [Proteobacteria bacterium]|nr:GTPase ObgE [Pseudomonadota bacterium]
MRFIDEATMAVKSGDGGNGAIAFRRERFRPMGGPAGGDGGRGGDVVFQADRNLGTLLDLRSHPHAHAKRGENGKGSDCHGRGAKPLIVHVPVGTIIYDNDTGEIVGDLVDHHQKIVVAKGGDGGKGNMRFSTSSNRAPRRAEPGFPGVTRTIRLELKLLADVGIVGLPNVGKSTLISRLSSAKPKVADYPFTTLIPNLGVVELGPGTSFVMADIPGIIRGASDGAGLGFRFLRHVQRTAILLHMVAPTEAEKDDLLNDFKDLSSEIEKFDKDLAVRPRIVALNKIDLPSARELEPHLKTTLKELGYDLILISAATGEGLEELKRRLGEYLREKEGQELS